MDSETGDSQQQGWFLFIILDILLVLMINLN